MALSKIPSAGFQDNVKFRNIIINGDMSISQRSQSASSISSSGYHALDRHRLGISSLGTWTISQSTDVPSAQGFAKSMKFDCTTADASPSASDYLFLSQRFEGQNLQYLKKGTSSAESLTLSFWVKSNKTGTYIAELSDVDNSRYINKSYTINSANTWEKKTITYAGDTTGTLDNDNAFSFRLVFWLGAGSDYTSGTLQTSWGTRVDANRAVGQVNLADSTSNEWYITGVQLESGEVASDFEFLPVDVNLRRCRRYYYKYDNYVISAQARGSTNFVCGSNSISHGGIFRANPTTTESNITYNRAQNLGVSSKSTEFVSYRIRSNGTDGAECSATFDLEFDAEL